MQYMGGKVRISKYLVPVLQERLKDKDTFVDLFCGSCNIISAIKAPNRIANDLHKELIALHKAVQQGWVPPSSVSELEYKEIKNSNEVPDYLKAFVGFGCSLEIESVIDGLFRLSIEFLSNIFHHFFELITCNIIHTKTPCLSWIAKTIHFTF